MVLFSGRGCTRVAKGSEALRRAADAPRVEERGALTLLQVKQLKEPKPKSPLPSTKKGRFSAKKVSKAERFTTAGSTSTCPKSGLMVATG
jgi:hypothetical protein